MGENWHTRRRLIEPIPIDDDYCTGLAWMEASGPNVRFFYFLETTCVETGATIFVVKRKLLLPRDVIPANLEIVRAFMAERARAVN